MSVEIARRHFTVDDFYRMRDAGIFTEDDRVELIDGEIVEMSPTGSRHSGCVMRLIALLTERLGRSVVVNVQNPVRLNSDAEPLPDLALLKPRDDFYSESHPTPEDVLLIIEVADSSVVYDLKIKAPLYARAGIAEFWVVDLTRDVVEAHSQPAGGSYGVVRRVGRGETLTSAQVPALSLSADDILG